ncbi:enolase C-terminal domain-like protein [Streptomyces sp. NPDC059837]|uniref:enolase C-terminal domain-like protein n=1 Tax=Streptomyces sp. NPDC059837 TaxID=3346968 RepID=UPI003651CBB5
MSPHLSAAYPRTAWVEHFEWLEPMFNERLEIAEGRLTIPDRPGLGLSLSEQTVSWTVESTELL